MKKDHIIILTCFLLLALLTQNIFAEMQYNVASYTFDSHEEAERFQALLKETRCVVCQNQSIADSNAPLANDLRKKIYGMIIHKRSDKEIKGYLVKRYGEFILLNPRLSQRTLLLWLFPFAGMLCAFLSLFFWVKKNKVINHL